MVIVAGPLAAPEIRARRRGRQEYHAALFVRRHWRPDVGMAGFDTAVLQRLKTPARTPAPRIEGAHRSLRRVDATVVRDRGADHHDAAAHHRRGRDLEFARPFQFSGIDPDLAAGTEIGAGNAGAGIERDHADVVGAHEYPRAASRGLGSLIVDPPGDAAAVVAVAGPLIGADVGIVPPLLQA